jgi:hypothetical protein
VTHGKSVNHGLEAEVDFSTADNLGDITGVVGLEESHLDVLVLEVTLGLSEVQGGMVGGRVPRQTSISIAISTTRVNARIVQYQLVRKVILSLAMVIEFKRKRCLG